jgi:hypothetical protein
MLVTDFRLAPNGFRRADIEGLGALIEGAGVPCFASGPTAGALHRFDGFVLRAPFDVMVARTHNLRRAGHRVHTTLDLEQIDRANVCGVAVLSPTRTIIDLAATSPPPTLSRAIDSALRDGGTSEDFLFRRIAALRRSGRYGIPALLEVLEGNEISRGGQTWLEREVLVLLAAAGLPRPLVQVVLARRGLKLIRVDFRFPGTRIVLEALGYRWHRSTAQMQADAERLNQLQLDGYLVLQCTYRSVAAGAVDTIRDLRRAFDLPGLQTRPLAFV